MSVNQDGSGSLYYGRDLNKRSNKQNERKHKAKKAPDYDLIMGKILKQLL